MTQESGFLEPGDTYSPRREDQAAAPASPAPQESERQPLDRIQRTLIWFASVLIAVTIFDRLRTYFGG
jgi:hypothetical protein